MLKEAVTAEGETVCEFILMLVLRRLLMVYFSQELGSVAEEALGQSQSVLAQSYSYYASQSWSSQTSLQLHG